MKSMILESKSEKGSWGGVICQTSIGNIAQDPEQFRNNRMLDKLQDTNRGWGERERDPCFGIQEAPFNLRIPVVVHSMVANSP